MDYARLRRNVEVAAESVARAAEAFDQLAGKAYEFIEYAEEFWGSEDGPVDAVAAEDTRLLQHIQRIDEITNALRAQGNSLQADWWEVTRDELIGDIGTYEGAVWMDHQKIVLDN